jgi:Na+-translocating ferredoxin:NAD+ oxidoreductase RnfC subunit
MHIGAPCVATVSVGDFVRKGQVIAQPPEGALGALIHASIDGRVTAVGERIVIEKE